MIVLNLIHTILFYILAVVSFLVGTTITLPFALFAREHHRPFQFSARKWARLLMLASGCPVTIFGAENIPKDGGMIFASNHQGAFDILIHLAYLPKYFRFVAKSELFKIPLFGWYMSLSGYVPIERDVSASAHRTIAGAADLLKKGESILIFPEGTRSKTGELGPFKRGSLMAAFQSGATVVPVAISGSYRMMPKHTFVINRVPLKVSFGRPISFRKYADTRPSKNDYEVELKVLWDEIERLLRS